MKTPQEYLSEIGTKELEDSINKLIADFEAKNEVDCIITVKERKVTIGVSIEYTKLLEKIKSH